MIAPRATVLIPALLLGLTVATGAFAQADQTEKVGVAYTAEVKSVDAKTSSIRVEGANGEKGVFQIGAKTTIMNGNQKVGIAGLHVGDWVAIEGNVQGKQTVATYIEVVEDVSPSEKAAPAEATAAGATITVSHNSLSPADVQIAAGQSVTFHNVVEMPGGHTVVASDGSFSSPALKKDQSWSHSFDVPGVYTVGIKEHPSAKATIIVE